MIKQDADFPSLKLDHLLADQAVLLLIENAAKLNASDLFFAANEKNYAVSIRHLGLVRPLSTLPSELGQRCVSRIKALANMDLTEHRRPLDGRWIHSLLDNRLLDLRINTIPTLHGEDCAIRLLMRENQMIALEDLGMIRREYNELLAMLNSPSGLILVTGPTGSGKTTSLYACLRYLNNGERKINTIEDPIEYAVSGVRQSQINPKIDLDFPEMLRSVMRQAPDVIMIGEIRDAVTATTAVRAANGGHLVLATLHAPVAAGAVQSMKAWDVHPHFLASSLLGVVAQRLVRTLCPDCRTTYPIDQAPDTFSEVQQWLEPGEGDHLTSAQGCATCHRTGYVGRTGVFEIMRVSKELRRIIASGQPTQNIANRAKHDGLIELRKAALLKVAKGITTAEEVIRAVPSEHLNLDD